MAPPQSENGGGQSIIWPPPKDQVEKIITKVKINCILICILKILPSSIRHSLGRHCKEVALAALQAGTTTLHCKRKNLIASSSIYPPRSVRLRTCDRVGVCVSAPLPVWTPMLPTFYSGFFDTFLKIGNLLAVFEILLGRTYEAWRKYMKI